MTTPVTCWLGRPAEGAAAWGKTSVANTFTGVSCPSTELCVAVGGGDITTSTDPTGGAGAWTVAKVVADSSEYLGGSELVGVSCASASLCFATEAGGEILTSTDPTGGASAWQVWTGVPFGDLSCPSVRMCVALTGEGDVVTSTDPTGGAGAWTVTKVDSHSLEDVSCSSETLCVATDSYGDVLTSTDPTGGTGAGKRPI